MPEPEQEPFPGSGRKARVLHVSADFPDPSAGQKTTVFKTLLELTNAQFDHQVISLNRVSPSAADLVRAIISDRSPASVVTGRQDFGSGTAINYRAPAKGILHKTMLLRLGDWIAGEIIRSGQKPDLIVAHKLTVEGISVWRAARQLGIPYAVTIQGDTDTKILAVRPDLRPLFKKVFHGAKVVASLAPWSLEAVAKQLGSRSNSDHCIPCPTELDSPVEPRPGEGLLSVFHLQSYRRKNLATMSQAFRHISAHNRNLSLAIVGGGSAIDLSRAKADAGNAQGIVFEGRTERAGMQARMNRATGFVLPSVRESFGLVFTEALFAGLPVIYPEGMAISGYFDDCSFAIPVRPDSAQNIAAAMQYLIDNEHGLKEDLARWQGSEHAQAFKRSAIRQSFAAYLSAGLPAKPVTAYNG